MNLEEGNELPQQEEDNILDLDDEDDLKNIISDLENNPLDVSKIPIQKSNYNPIHLIPEIAVEKEAPLKVLEQEFAKIVQLEKEQANNKRMLKEEMQKYSEFIKVGEKFSEGDINERESLLEEVKNQEIEFVFSGLVEASKLHIEKFIKLYLLGAIESSVAQLNLLQENEIEQQIEMKKFDTFNPVSFGPGQFSPPKMLKEEIKMQEEIDQVEQEIKELTLEKKLVDEEIGSMKKELSQIRQETSQIQDSEENNKAKADHVKKIKEMQEMCKQMEEDIKKFSS